MFDWLRNLFRKKNNQIVHSGPALNETAKFQLRQEAQQAVNRIERKEEKVFQPHSIDDLRKYAQQQRIARQNEERQKATMGYGLKSRNFKPRPAHEKRLFDLSKKPEEENA